MNSATTYTLNKKRSPYFENVDWQYLGELGYRKSDGTFTAQLNEARKTKASPMRYVWCRCRCGKEQAVNLSSIVRAQSKRCQSCAAKVRSKDSATAKVKLTETLDRYEESGTPFSFCQLHQEAGVHHTYLYKEGNEEIRARADMLRSRLGGAPRNRDDAKALRKKVARPRAEKIVPIKRQSPKARFGGDYFDGRPDLAELMREGKL